MHGNVLPARRAAHAQAHRPPPRRPSVLPCTAQKSILLSSRNAQTRPPDLITRSGSRNGYAASVIPGGPWGHITREGGAGRVCIHNVASACGCICAYTRIRLRTGLAIVNAPAIGVHSRICDTPETSRPMIFHRAGDWLQSLVARITSDALITAVTWLPSARPRSRTASTVIDATRRTRWPVARRWRSPRRW
jgi:hypothetical protein